jgi:hypothetical protein
MTHMLCLQSNLGVHVLPYQERFPPMSKSNHTYVELLMPQSKQDQAKGGRTEWFSTCNSLSTIPHTHFGKLPVAAVTFNISVFFPHMKHRDPVTDKMAMLIPWEMQCEWLTKVVHLAIIAGENLSTMAYRDYTLDEWRWKASLNKHFKSGAKTVPVRGEHLKQMQIAMRNIVKENPDDPELDRFSSFFFVLDGLGMKESTMVEMSQGRDLYTVLCDKFPQLD